MSGTVLPVSPRYRETFWFALGPQIPVAIVCLLMLDAGILAKICGSTMLGFWAGAFYCMGRRPRNPSPTDFLFIRWCFWPLFAGAIAMGAALTAWA
jgi:hypothetical protein